MRPIIAVPLKGTHPVPAGSAAALFGVKIEQC